LPAVCFFLASDREASGVASLACNVDATAPSLRARRRQTSRGMVGERTGQAESRRNKEANDQRRASHGRGSSTSVTWPRLGTTRAGEEAKRRRKLPCTVVGREAQGRSVGANGQQARPNYAEISERMTSDRQAMGRGETQAQIALYSWPRAGSEHRWPSPSPVFTPTDVFAGEQAAVSCVSCHFASSRQCARTDFLENISVHTPPVGFYGVEG